MLEKDILQRLVVAGNGSAEDFRQLAKVVLQVVEKLETEQGQIVQNQRTPEQPYDQVFPR